MSTTIRSFGEVTSYDARRSKGGNEMSEWVSVKDKMPEPFVSVLGYMPDAAPFPEVRECYCTGDSDKKFFVPALSERHEISHWAELPEPPKEEHHAE